MDNASAVVLSLIVFLPVIGAVVLALPIFSRENPEVVKWVTLLFAVATFLLVVALMLGVGGVKFSPGVADMQNLFSIDWIPSFHIHYLMGLDGISFPLVLLTAFLSLLAIGASWSIDRHVKAYCMLFLVLQTAMIGVFMALDFFLFYVLWEVMLLPMYFLIGIWGGPRRLYAAIKFFLYTLVGSVLMLIAILMLYFNSDLRELTPQQLLVCGVVASEPDEASQSAAIQKIHSAESPQHTFNILALQEIGQHTQLFNREMLWGRSLQWWAFLLLFVGFVIKVPSVPLHTWLPDAHVEAPTPISMILAGVLLKMGGYGIIRICYPICPQAGYDLALFVCTVGVVSMVYGAFAALAQKDFKRLVAYSSVSHMGYVVLGFGVWSATIDANYLADYWKMGMNGAMFQMIAHGISSSGMFFLVGVLYDRVHHRNLEEFGGVFSKMPVYSGLAMVIFFAGLGLPGLCGFIGEILVVLSVWRYDIALAIIAAAVVVLTAGYILWTIQRVYLGAEYHGPHGESLTPITLRELAIAIPLVLLAIFFGVYPRSVFDYMTPSVNKTVDELAAWTRSHEPAERAVHHQVHPDILIRDSMSKAMDTSFRPLHFSGKSR